MGDETGPEGGVIDRGLMDNFGLVIGATGATTGTGSISSSSSTSENWLRGRAGKENENVVGEMAGEFQPLEPLDEAEASAEESEAGEDGFDDDEGRLKRLAVWTLRPRARAMGWEHSGFELDVHDVGGVAASKRKAGAG